MTFKPLPCADRWRGLLLVLGILLLDGLVLRLILGRPADGLSFVLALLLLASLLIGVYVGYRTLGSFTLEYWVDRDAVTLVWGPARQVVPIGQIRRIQRGVKLDAVQPLQFWHWPCHDCRQNTGQGLGVVHSYATCGPEQQLILVTGGDCYGLSPADPEGFIAALQERYALGVARPRQLEVERPPLWRWPLWRDWKALCLIGIGFVGVVIMFGALSFRFPGLPSDVPLHFDVSGLPDRIAPKDGLFALPMISLAAWLFNLAAGIFTYRRVQRQGAYLLWAGAVAVQMVAALALFNLMQW